MAYRVHFNTQPIVDANSWQEAQVRAAKELIEAVSKCDLSKPVESLMELGFSVSISTR